MMLLPLMLLAFGSLLGQTSGVKGKLVDAQDETPLSGAYVILISQESQEEKAAVADADGVFLLTKLEKGEYLLRITYLGYLTREENITLGNRLQDMGTIRLEQSGIDLAEVQVKDKIPPAKQLGDTTQFNAAAYKMNPDADAQDLISKLPGVTLENGQVKAQGENVQQVLVDGKPFFGNDPQAAMKNLPAEVIERIQIFDQQSDQSQFTGFNDGQTTKTINIITKSSMKEGQFGKFYFGGGQDLDEAAAFRYRTGGTLNFFNGDTRLSVIGQSNNINIQNFATEDLLGVVGSSGGGRGGGFGGRGGGSWGRSGGINDFLVDQSGGISTTHALGINYSDMWGKKMEVTASYFFNNSINDAFQYLDRLFVDNSEVERSYTENSGSDANNVNHRFNARLDYKISEKTSLLIRPSFSFQQNDGNSNTEGVNFSGLSIISETLNDFASNLDGLKFDNSILIRHRLNKPRRTVSLDLRTGYNDNTGVRSLSSVNNFYTGSFFDQNLLQSADLLTEGWSFSSNLSFTEPVGERGMIMTNYRYSYQDDNSDQETRDFNEVTQNYDILNQLLSNSFANNQSSHSLTSGYNYNKDKVNFMLRGGVQFTELINDQTLPNPLELTRNYVNFIPMAMFRYNFSKQTNMRLFYRTSTQTPRVDQLQDVLNNSNPLQLSIGNPNLDQSYQHSLFLRYSATNTEKSNVFYFMLGGSFTQNNISNAIYTTDSDNPIFQTLDVGPGTQLTQPVNLDGAYNLRSFLTYGVPLSPIKSNLNFNLSGTFVRTPGLINELKNYSQSSNMGLGLVLSSNVSEKVDFTLSSQTNYNLVSNSIQTNANNNFLSQLASLRLNLIIGKGFVVRSDINYQYFDGLSEDIDPDFFLWNASVGKKIFKNQRGELSLSVFDLLKQNNSISRVVTEIYIEDKTVNTLQRYGQLTFTYNLRNFGKGLNERASRDRRPEWMRWNEQQSTSAPKTENKEGAPKTEENTTSTAPVQPGMGQGPGSRMAEQTAALVEKLGLDAAQEAAFKEIQEKFMSRMSELRSSSGGDFSAMREKMQGLRSEQEEALKKVLTTEQFEAYKKYQEESRAQWRRN